MKFLIANMDLNRILGRIKVEINPGAEALIPLHVREPWLRQAGVVWMQAILNQDIINAIIASMNEYLDSLTREEWRSLGIIGFSNYMASNIGRIKNVRANRILKCGMTADDYVRVAIFDDNHVLKFKKVHVLIAFAFIANPENKPTVDHINRNRSDNNISNLRWATFTEQNYNRTETRGLNMGRTIVQLTNEGDIVNFWNSAAEAQRASNIDSRRIIEACRGQRNSTSFTWSYLEDFEDLNPNEIWMPIPFPELNGYFASSIGRVKRPDERILKGSFKKGYQKMSVD